MNLNLSAPQTPKGPASDELQAMRKTDQAARQFAGMPTPEEIHRMEAGDRYREARVRQLLYEDKVVTTDDFEAAALIMQHGGDPEDYLLARELALLAATDKSFSSLVGLAEDRYLLAIGRKQRLGSQFRFNSEGKPEFRELDESGPAAVSDGHRADMLIAPLDLIRQKGMDAFKELGPMLRERLEKRRDPKWRETTNRRPISRELERLASGTEALQRNAISRVLDLYRHDRLLTREDLFHAANVLALSSEAQTVLLANELAALSAMHGHFGGRLLYAETWDRFSAMIGKPDRYGTRSGKPKVSPVVRRMFVIPRVALKVDTTVPLRRKG